MTRQLFDRTVRSVRPGLYPDGGGLYLQVTEGTDGTPRRSWLFRFATTDAERATNSKLARGQTGGAAVSAAASSERADRQTRLLP
jgi:hypothetical protein